MKYKMKSFTEEKKGVVKIFFKLLSRSMLNAGTLPWEGALKTVFRLPKGQSRSALPTTLASFVTSRGGRRKRAGDVGLFGYHEYDSLPP
mmetsp:Transcript_52697/g.120088  ORF Transcript_52697/g.120088 Transcript_52697/m.120088 type:complete len:89 (-) Transcript_52697:27-293(-)